MFRCVRRYDLGWSGCRAASISLTRSSARRHQVILAVLWAHVPGLLLVGLLQGLSPSHAVLEVLPVVAAALGAMVIAPRALRAAAASLGLLAASAVAIHITGGLVEAHFHIFVVLIVVALYQDWRPLTVGILFTLVHHVTASINNPSAAFNHPAAMARPLLWSAIHACFVAGEVVAVLLFWQVTEKAQRAADLAEAGRRAESVANASLWAELQNSEQLAYTDELTGLPNRRLFNSIASERPGAAQRRDDLDCFCVAMIDLDHFKHVNDRFGHAIGDQVLRSLAMLARNMLRMGDCFARMGGEEFALYLPHTSIEDAVALVGRLRQTIEQMPLLPDDEFRVTLSAGVAVHPSDRSIYESLAAADDALYLAKQTGRNRVCLAPDLSLISFAADGDVQPDPFVR